MTQNHELEKISLHKSSSKKQKTKLIWIEEFNLAFQGDRAKKILQTQAELKKAILEKEIALASPKGSILIKFLTAAEKWLYPVTFYNNLNNNRELVQLKNNLALCTSETLYNCNDGKQRTEKEIASLKSDSKHLSSLANQTLNRLEYAISAWNDVAEQTNALILPYSSSSREALQQLKHLCKITNEISNGIDVFTARYRNHEEVADEFINASPLKARIITLAKALHPRKLQKNNILMNELSKTPHGRDMLNNLLEPKEKIIPCKKPNIKIILTNNQQKHQESLPYRTQI